MRPDNLPALTAFRPDVCAPANNHILDFGYQHSSHHPRPIEIYRGKPILYGCGDVIGDYEGIGGHESFCSDLRLLYSAWTDPAGGELISLQMVPLRVRQMRLERASHTDADGYVATTFVGGLKHLPIRYSLS